MNKTELRLIVNLFKYYYSNVFKRSGYRFKITDSKQKTIENFCQRIKDLTDSNKLQEDYLRQYFEFQFNHWYKYQSKSEVSSVQIEWIVGNKAIERWKKSDRKIATFIVRKNLKTDVNFKDRVKKENYNNIILNLSIVEEEDKKRFFNEARGKMNCLVSTTLYNHKSEYCSMCKFRQECKEELKTTYPKIYKKRGYVC